MSAKHSNKTIVLDLDATQKPSELHWKLKIRIFLLKILMENIKIKYTIKNKN